MKRFVTAKDINQKSSIAQLRKGLAATKSLIKSLERTFGDCKSLRMSKDIVVAIEGRIKQLKKAK